MTAPAILEVSVHLAATPEVVFPYFTVAARYVEWMGSEAMLEPVPGGVYRVRMSDGFAAAGNFVEVAAPHWVVFTWGWADEESAQHVLHEQTDSHSGLRPGSTRVEVTLDEEDGGTRLVLRHHDLPTDELRDAHRVAWETYSPARHPERGRRSWPGPARLSAGGRGWDSHPRPQVDHAEVRTWSTAGGGRWVRPCQVNRVLGEGDGLLQRVVEVVTYGFSFGVQEWWGQNSGLPLTMATSHSLKWSNR